MIETATEQTLTDSLIALKTQYERSLTEASTKASHLREQLSHVNALLLTQLLTSDGVVLQLTQSAVQVPVVEVIAPSFALVSAPSLAASPTAEAPPSDRPKPKASTRKPKATAEPTPTSGKRSPRPLLPAYEGLKRLEAIAQLLQATPGQGVTADQVSEGLFGPLSAVDHKAERKSLNTQLYKGQSLNLWQKGTAPGTFMIGASTPSESAQLTPKARTPKAKAPATTSAKRKSLPLLPTYAELSKGNAIAQILGQHTGEILHHDTIIQTLYGNLSPEDLREERVRIKTVLFTGVKDGKWKKASVPSSYVLEEPAADAKPKRPGRKPDLSKEPIPQPEPVVEAEAAITLFPVAKATAAKPKSGRKPAVAKAKAPQKKARPKRTEAELLEMLQKADIQV
jgi:hypothetical protein